MTNLTSLVVLILTVRTRSILSSFLLAIKDDRALCMAVRFSWIACDVGFMVRVVSSSESVNESFGFFPNTSWKEEKPATFYRLFLASRIHERASSGEQLVSETILSIMLGSVWLFLSTTQLLHGGSVVLMFMPRYSHISVKSLFAHSPPLSISILSGEPHATIHVRNIAFMIVSVFVWNYRCCWESCADVY